MGRGHLKPFAGLQRSPARLPVVAVSVTTGSSQVGFKLSPQGSTFPAASQTPSLGLWPNPFRHHCFILSFLPVPNYWGQPVAAAGHGWWSPGLTAVAGGWRCDCWTSCCESLTRTSPDLGLGRLRFTCCHLRNNGQAAAHHVPLLQLLLLLGADWTGGGGGGKIREEGTGGGNQCPDQAGWILQCMS